MQYTQHFMQRASQRGLRPQILEFVVAYGVETVREGFRFITVALRALPRGLPAGLVEKAKGWVVVQGLNGHYVTCYRRDPDTAVAHVRSKVHVRGRGCQARDLSD